MKESMHSYTHSVALWLEAVLLAYSLIANKVNRYYNNYNVNSCGCSLSLAILL